MLPASGAQRFKELPLSSLKRLSHTLTHCTFSQLEGRQGLRHSMDGETAAEEDPTIINGEGEEDAEGGGASAGAERGDLGSDKAARAAEDGRPSNTSCSQHFLEKAGEKALMMKRLRMQW